MTKRIALDVTALRVVSFATDVQIRFDATDLATCDPCDGLTPDCESVPCDPNPYDPNDTHGLVSSDCTQPGVCPTVGVIL